MSDDGENTVPGRNGGRLRAPWKKGGPSPNPAGRPRADGLRRRAAKALKRALERVESADSYELAALAAVIRETAVVAGVEPESVQVKAIAALLAAAPTVEERARIIGGWLQQSQPALPAASTESDPDPEARGR